MLKRIFYIVLMCCLMCGGIWLIWYGSYSPAMNQAEQLFAESRYIELRQMLDSIKGDILQEGKSVRMRYHLLNIKTDNVLGARPASDSLALSVVDYYENGGNKAYLGDAYYYVGNIYHDLNDANRALEYYQKALDTMEGMQNEPTLLAKEHVYEQMGHLFYGQQLTEQAHESLKKARSIAKQLNDTIGMIRIYRDVGKIFLQKKNYLMAHHNLNVATNLSLLIKRDGGLYRSVLLQECLLYMAEDEWSSVENLLNMFLKRPRITDDKEMLYTIAGDYHAHGQRYDSAAFYYNKLLQMESVRVKREASGKLLDVAARAGDKEMVLPYLLKYQQYTDSVLNITDTENIARINALYNSRQLERQNEALHKEKQRYAFYAIVISLLMLILVAGVLVYYRMSKAEIQQLRTNNALLDEFRMKQTDERKQIMMTSELYKRLQHSLMPAKDADWEEMTNLINQVYPDFLTRLGTLGILKEQELKVCMALKMGFKPAEIARLISRERNTITNARARMYKKVTGKVGKAEDWDEIIMKL